MTTNPNVATHTVTEDPPNPDVAEVQQRAYPGPALKVCPDGPWPTVLVPAREGAAFTEVLSSTTEVRKLLGGPDYKRKRVWINTDADVFVSFTGTAGTGMRLHGAAAVQGAVEITYIGPIFVQLAAAGTANVGVLVEYWAD